MEEKGDNFYGATVARVIDDIAKTGDLSDGNYTHNELYESNKVLKKENIVLNRLVNSLTSNKKLTAEENAIMLSDIATIKGDPFK